MNLGVKVCGTASSTSNAIDVCPPLTNQLIKRNYNIEVDVSKARYLLCINHQNEIYRTFRRNGGKPENTILIRLEPAAVFPSQYQPRIENLYGKIFTPGSIIIGQESFLPWPYYYNQNPLAPTDEHPDLKFIVESAIRDGNFEVSQWKSRDILLSLIASNKVSPTGANNYKLRRQLARELPARVLTIYGSLWKAGLRERTTHRAGVLMFAIKSRTFPNLIEISGRIFDKYISAVGMVRNKHEVVVKSKFSLVIENDNHYVSEKLLDALIGGAIPIYFGGDYTRVGIPKEAVVSELIDAKGIMEFLEAVTDSEAQNYLNAAQTWLHSAAFYDAWSGDSVFARIADEIAEYFRNVEK